MQKLEPISTHDAPRHAESNVEITGTASLFCALFTLDAYVGDVGFEKSTFGDLYPL